MTVLKLVFVHIVPLVSARDLLMLRATCRDLACVLDDQEDLYNEWKRRARTMKLRDDATFRQWRRWIVLFELTVSPNRCYYSFPGRTFHLYEWYGYSLNRNLMFEEPLLRARDQGPGRQFVVYICQTEVIIRQDEDNIYTGRQVLDNGQGIYSYDMWSNIEYALLPYYTEKMSVLSN